MDIKITDTAYGGFGVGRTDEGKAIFVPFTVTGDIVQVAITEDKKNFAYAKLNKIIEASPLRVLPICPYVGTCGGCLFGHIKYDSQIKIKENIVKNAFRKYPYTLDKIKVIPSGKTGYRLRCTFRAQNGKLGFYGFKSRDFVPVKKCLIVKESLFEKTKFFAVENHLTGDVYVIETDDGITLGHITSETSNIKSKNHLEGFSWNGFKIGLEYTGYHTSAGVIGVGHKTFFQANRFLLDEFQTVGAEFAKTALNITELYGGAGFFTAALMKNSNQLNGCEIDEEGVKLAHHFGYPIQRSDAGNYLEKIKETEVLFMNPARDGVSNKVISNILRLKPRKIVYVSCNPATLARDAMKLANYYKITNMAIFDMFPDTFHVEIVVKFIKI